jgi:hypothetical protein
MPFDLKGAGQIVTVQLIQDEVEVDGFLSPSIAVHRDA